MFLITLGPMRCDDALSVSVAGDVLTLIELTLILPHGAEASEVLRFPQPITVTRRRAGGAVD